MVRVLDLACRRGQFAPLAAAVRPRHSESLQQQFARCEKIFGDTFFWQEVFRCAIKKNICFTATTFCQNSITSSWYLAASTPVVSSCRCSARALSSVSDELLPANITEYAQQIFSTYKIFNTYLIHTCASCMCFASVENSAMSVTKTDLGKNSINCFRKEKSSNCSAMLVINFSIKWIYLESSCFYFPKNDSEND